MPNFLLLLPLVGGYFLLDRFNPTRLVFKKLEGHKLVFWSTVPAVVLYFLSSVIVYILSRLLPDVANFWYNLIRAEHSGTAILAMLLGFLFAFIGNLFPTEAMTRNLIAKMTIEKADPLEMLFLKAVNEEKNILITLKNHKAYVGRITKEISPASPLEHIQILPIRSGYREQDTKILHLPLSYEKVFLELIKDESAISIQDFQIVIPASEIISAHIFDQETYDTYFKKQKL